MELFFLIAFTGQTGPGMVSNYNVYGTVTVEPDASRKTVFDRLLKDYRERYPHLRDAAVVFLQLEPNKF